MQQRIYRLSVWCGLITAMAFVVPRFVPSQEGGFASAANAVLAFFGILVLAAGLSLYLFAMTVRAYRNLPWPPRVAGIAPAVILVAGLALLFGALRF